MDQDVPEKIDRLKEIFRRMNEADACQTASEAYHLLCSTMDEVEDELTPYPNSPERWRDVPRLFPPQRDRASRVDECDVERFDSLRHGAIEIRTRRIVGGRVEVHFSKQGADGRRVSDVCPRLRMSND